MRRAFRVFFSVLLPLTCAAPAIGARPRMPAKCQVSRPSS